jgi:hypothetical protein
MQSHKNIENLKVHVEKEIRSKNGINGNQTEPKQK